MRSLHAIAFQWLERKESVYVTGHVSMHKRHASLDSLIRYAVPLYQQKHRHDAPHILAMHIRNGQPFAELSSWCSENNLSFVSTSFSQCADVGVVIPSVITSFLNELETQTRVLVDHSVSHQFSSRFPTWRKKYAYPSPFLHRLKRVTHLLLVDLFQWPCHLFHHLDVALRICHDKPDAPFGGVAVLMEGDPQRPPPSHSPLGHVMLTSLIKTMVADRSFTIQSASDSVSDLDTFWERIRWIQEDSLQGEEEGDPEDMENGPVSSFAKQTEMYRHFSTSLAVGDTRATQWSSSFVPERTTFEAKTTRQSSSSPQTALLSASPSNAVQSSYSGPPLHVCESKKMVETIQRDLLDTHMGHFRQTKTVRWTYVPQSEVAISKRLTLSDASGPTILSDSLTDRDAQIQNALGIHFEKKLQSFGWHQNQWKEDLPVRYCPSTPTAIPYGTWGILKDIRDDDGKAVVLFPNDMEEVVHPESHTLYHSAFSTLKVDVLPLRLGFAVTSYDLQVCQPYHSGLLMLHYTNNMAEDHGRLYQMFCFANDLKQVRWCGASFPRSIEWDMAFLARVKAHLPLVQATEETAWALQWCVLYDAAKIDLYVPQSSASSSAAESSSLSLKDRLKRKFNTENEKEQEAHQRRQKQ